MRLIDADVLMDELYDELCDGETLYRIPPSAIDDAPTVDAAPVVHGRWVPFHSEVAGDIQYCSACEIGNAAKSNFCPRCGAKMDLDGGGANG